MKKFLLFILIITSSSIVNAQKLFSKEWKLQQLGKDSVSLAEAAKTKEAKRAKEISIIDLNKNGIKAAGMYLKKSANYQYGSLACLAMGSGAAIGAAYSSEKKDRNLLLVSGGCVASIGLILQLKAIDYKLKSGTALEFAGDKISFKF